MPTPTSDPGRARRLELQDQHAPPPESAHAGGGPSDATKLSVDEFDELSDNINELNVELEAYLQELVRRRVQQFRDAVKALDDQRHDLAVEFQPHFRELARSLPQDSFAEKQEVAARLNAELRSRGLAVSCPRTRRASYLTVEAGDYPKVGRFQFTQTINGKTVRTKSATVLPDLVLTAEKLPSLEPSEGSAFAEAVKSKTPSQASSQKP